MNSGGFGGWDELITLCVLPGVAPLLYLSLSFRCCFQAVNPTSVLMPG